MSKIDVSERTYATRAMITPEQAERAKHLADRMLAILNRFHEELPEEVHDDLRTIRAELEEMGFLVQYEVKIDTATGKVANAFVKLFLALPVDCEKLN